MVRARTLREDRLMSSPDPSSPWLRVALFAIPALLVLLLDLVSPELVAVAAAVTLCVAADAVLRA
ncbi:MAG: hypothetical protein JWQ18_2309, partial [Conexibacter sp.]|nr:hypothetical protein [Conexibacter sp.]